MKTVTIRDLRLHWPATEKALLLENELTVTRDGVPVAKLIRFLKPKAKRARWNPEKQAARINGILGGKMLPSIDSRLAANRADRDL